MHLRRLFLALILSIIQLVKSSDLYSDEPNIASLNDETFFHSVLNKDYLILSIYYKHWSPTCIRFSRIFKNFSGAIKSWNKVVRLVSIDCAKNLVCRQALRANGTEQGILNFPILQFILPGSQDLSNGIKQVEAEAIDDLIETTVQVILSDSKLANRYHLIPTIAKSITEICYTLKDDNYNYDQKESYAIIEPKPSSLGAMIILDLINYRDFLTIKRYVADSDLTSPPYNMNTPLILEVTSPCQYRIIGKMKNLRTLRKKFVYSIREKYIMEVPETETDLIEEIFEDSYKVVKHNLSYVDLHNTLRYSLVFEIVTRKFFNEKQIQAIKQIYSAILNFFPFDNENVKRFFKRMTGWLENKKTNLPIERYLATIKTSDGFLKPMESWRHCNGSKPIYRGYPCGLWVLFHAMTVNEYNITVSSKNPSKPKVLHAMRSYIQTFFSCPECREYFLNISNNLEEDLIHPNSSVLWLWKIHNQYNSFLADYEENVDPYYPKYQFPTKELCADCIKNNGQYDERQVFNFLCNYYSKKSIRNASLSGIKKRWMSLIMMIILIIVSLIF